MAPRTTQKIVTIKDVARHANIGLGTASRALSGRGAVKEATREIVLRAAQELGFEPNPNARRLAVGGCEKTVALFTVAIDAGVGLRKTHVIQSLLANQGWDVPVYSYGYGGIASVFDQQLLLRRLCAEGPRAIALNNSGLAPESLDEVRKYLNAGGIVVSYDMPSDLACDSVEFDREDNTYQAARHLLELGHRHLGFFQEGGGPVSSSRLKGFKRALSEFGAPFEPHWVQSCESDQRDEEGGEVLAQIFLKLQKRPTGCCIVNDRAASVFVNRLLNAGLRVPQDVSVVSHDDLPAARGCVVPLTSVSHPYDAIAQWVVHQMNARLAGDVGAPVHGFIYGTLSMRQSTAKITPQQLRSAP